jgi:hypothetical protein
MRFFGFTGFGGGNPFGLLINPRNYFRFFVNLLRYWTFRTFRVFSVYAQFHSALTLYTVNFILRTIGVHTMKIQNVWQLLRFTV